MSELCVEKGNGTAFCSKECKTNADCENPDYACKTFDDYKFCIAATEEWCQ
jgi:hypothetical protein